MKHLAWLIVLIVPFAAAQPLTPIYFWELAAQPTDLSHAPSTTDLVNDFPEASGDGILSNEILNESANGEFMGDIDPFNDVVSYLIPDSVCLQVGTQPSDGFHEVYPRSPTILVNGQLNGPLDGILRDYAFAALVVRIGFTTPTNIGDLRVIGGNTNNADGRTFHHYDVWASTDGLGQFGSYFLVAEGVRTGEFGTGNPGLWSGSLTEVYDFDSATLVSGATDLRIVFYCVDNTQAFFVDPWQGLANESQEFIDNCGAFGEDPEDTDGFRRAFVAPVIREIDVFAPGVNTPWGDIDYDDDSDLVDAASFQTCFMGSVTSDGCFRYDLDENAFVDADDVDLFLALVNGPA